jgi:RHS repeat-associated protein
LTNAYDGDRLRAKKDSGTPKTYYVRSSVLGGQVVAELDQNGLWTRGYVYMGGQMVALQGGTGGAVSWVHQDPVTKSQRVTNSSGTIVSTIDLDPFGGETARSAQSAFQPRKYTTYERDSNGSDEAMHRRFDSTARRFSQPDPYDGSYSRTNPQSFNRYAYVQNDLVNFVDPSGLIDTVIINTWAPSWPSSNGDPAPGPARPLNERTGEGGSAGGNPQNPREPPGTPEFVNSEAVKACAEKLFGITEGGLDYQPGNGRIGFQGFNERQSSIFNSSAGWLYITPNNSKNSSQITADTHAGMRGGTAFGSTDPSDPSHPYIANDISGSFQYGMFVHELGNALAFLTGKFHIAWLTGRQVYDDPNIRPSDKQRSTAGHDDPGVTFEDCVRNYKP